MMKMKKIMLTLCWLVTAFSMQVFADNTADTADTANTTTPSTTSASQTASPSTQLLDQKINAFMHNQQVPGAAVELYVDGKLYEFYYGYADQEKKEAVTRKTIFELGSISKIMTSLLLAQEIDWAKMSLTDPVTHYVDDLPEKFNKITLQDLATHTSGLPFDLPENVKTEEAVDHYLSQLMLRSSPGKEWIYSNIGMGLLGYALESLNERDFADLYQRHVLNPLNMVTSVSVPDKLAQYYAQGHDKSGQVAPHVNADLFPAADGIKASAADMQRFLAAAIGLPGTPTRVFYPMRMTESIYVKIPGGYQGLGWQIHTLTGSDRARLLNVPANFDVAPKVVLQVYARPLYNGDTLLDKTGATAGFRAYIAVLPNKKSGIVVLANKAVPTSALVKTAREILFTLALS